MALRLMSHFRTLDPQNQTSPYKFKTEQMNKYYTILLALIIFASCQSIKITESTDYSTYLRNDKMIITKDSLLHTKELIKRYHPNPFNSISEVKFDSLIDEVSKTFPTDSIPETEYIYQYRKAFDKITNGDPHFLILPQLRIYPQYEIKNKNILVWPFKMLCINDTLIIDESISPELQKGDQIISINERSAKEIVKYTYHHRFLDSRFTQAQNHFCFTPSYKIQYLRKGQKHKIKIPGVPLNKYYFKEEYYPETIYSDYKTGYFGIKNFDNNKFMIKRLAKFIKKVQAKGFSNIIIDVRSNSGGSGDRFDELISLFTDKDSVGYQSGSRVMVSKKTLDYGFSEDSIGKVCDMPEAHIIKSCPLDIEKYAGKMNYYVLISKYTASQASSFANIMQYNKFAILVGEPLAHNALRYGEITTSPFNNSLLVISTVEMDEYSNQENGIIMPDVLIPYKAEEYKNGGDPILEKCLEHINLNKSLSYK